MQSDAVAPPILEPQPRLRSIAASMWPLMGVFYLLGLAWLFMRYGGCQDDRIDEWICNLGAAPSYIAALLALAGLAWMGRDLATFGAPSPSAPPPPRPLRWPWRVRAGYRQLRMSDQRHVQHALRANLYLLGGTLGFLLFWLPSGRLLEAGAWLVQLGFIVGAEWLISWLRSPTPKRPDDEPPQTREHAGLMEDKHVVTARPQDAGLGKDSRTGLALSGGGIRSATFCLGVLQALSARSQLRRFDYLSTVSGGSYIGCWLSAWIHSDGLDKVEAKLGQRKAKDGADRPPEPPQVSWLRQYSNYLAPRVGILSADSLTLVATWLRNVMLNLTVVVCLLMTLYVAARLAIGPAIAAMTYRAVEAGYVAAWVGLFIVPLAISFNLTFGRERTEAGPYWIATTEGVLATVLLPGTIAALFASLSFFSQATEIDVNLNGRLVIALVPLVIAGATWLVLSVRNQNPQRALFGEAIIFLIAYLTALVIAYLLVRLSRDLVFNHGSGPSARPVSDVEGAARVLTFGPPLLLMSFGICGSVVVGIVGRVYFERSREWWGRMNAWSLGVGVGWLVFFSLVFYAKPLVDWVIEMGGTWAKSLGLAGWLGSLFASLTASKPPAQKTLLQRMGGRALDLAATVVIAGFLIGVAYGTAMALRAVAGTAPDGAAVNELKLKSLQVAIGPQGEVGTTTAAFDLQPKEGLGAHLTHAFEGEAAATLFQFCAETVGPPAPGCDGAPIPMLPIAALVMLAGFGLFSWRVDVNKFSLHNMYKNRLIRCYLGASRMDVDGLTKRRPQPFTGFDDDDDPELHTLRTSEHQGELCRPLHIINAALNITHGDNLAWQERKAASFTFSPLHAGYTLPRAVGDTEESLRRAGSYRNTEWYASERDEQRRFTLGMALATSGAALSPNMGTATSKPLAFLMTLFNVRLGRWSPNPARLKWMQSSPRLGLMCLLQELFGYANEVRSFVYLSDGGHFENTGVYELVRRRCTTIVAVDAGADSQRTYEDLANLVRKCRVDFDARIDLDLNLLGTTLESSLSSKGYAVGRIDYPTGRTGTLILLKPTLVQMMKVAGIDVFGYSKVETDFPQQTTADQFFDERQFESYRALGEAIAAQAMLDIRSSLSH